MALLDDVTKAATSPAGLLAGVGALLLTPIVVPAVRDGLRPAAKAALRAVITVYRETVEPVQHAMHDLVTEARLELQSARDSSGGDSSAAASGQGRAREA
jgi:hypothetical protein